MDKKLFHYGTPRHSGRYPWGSGENPYQRNRDILIRAEELKKKGMTEKDIALTLNMTTSELRNRKSLGKSEERAENVARAVRLKDKGYSNTEIGRLLGKNESTVRTYLDPVLQERADIAKTTANVLKENVSKKGYIDIGVGVERHIGVSRTKLKTALTMLEDEGYKIHYLKVPQVGSPGKYTSTMVLTAPGTTYSEFYKNRDKISLVNHYTEDGGRTYLGLDHPKQVDSNRILVRYKEDGGKDKDGLIELKRGVEDISLGASKYAQVRIGVDGTHYLKGMAMYSDDIPKGYDIVFNTDKSKDIPKKETFKPIKDDDDNPFGSIVRQKHYIDSNGEKQLSALNIVGYSTKDGSGEEGSWGAWSKNISSQVLSKQTPSLAKKQLDLSYNIRKDELAEINALTNSAIKKRLLIEFADGCDSDTVFLQAAALPRQQSHVILPLTNIKETEIYAPNYRNGEQVVLIRHPHGGIFEIPQLKVNNTNEEGKKLLGAAKDAVGIHPSVAQKLSGADFDGDTVLVIPNPPRIGVRVSSSLTDLKDFDPKTVYKGYDGMQKMTRTDYEMGVISNLITDMTIKGAKDSEIARAVKHSMVVIDAEKHGLDYKQSYIDNGIAQLKNKYQGGTRAGASTLISKAKSDKRVPLRKDTYKIDPQTGKKIWDYETDNLEYVNKKGKVVTRTTKSTKMAEVDDAFELSSGSVMENVYATYANNLKALANTARKESLKQTNLVYSKSANAAYSNEVKALKAKLNVALKNAPLERNAQIYANSIVSAKRKANPDMDGDDLKKIKVQALQEGRNRIGANKKKIEVTDKEWEAIQAGAISNNMLSQIINNMQSDQLKALATPRTVKVMTDSKIARAKAMLNSGYTQAEIADHLGVSVSTLNSSLK